jgi:hypothetical protein
MKASRQEQQTDSNGVALTEGVPRNKLMLRHPERQWIQQRGWYEAPQKVPKHDFRYLLEDHHTHHLSAGWKTSI